jgi:hypothetical protein
MARGNERKAVFRDDRDRQWFLDTLAEMVERFGVRLAGGRGVAVARDFGYRGGSGVGQVVRRLEQQSAADQALLEKLARIRKNLSSVES